MIGRTLSHYRIVEKLGQGGMGEVYLAEDTKLDRKVALKVLPPEMASLERRARFEREAKAIAALNHPNIVHVYSVEEEAGVSFLTMELVRGKTLAELLPAGGFPMSRFFEIAIPLSDAVASAHARGITHRDLKPENVMESDEGRVKVLDFGLAKLKPGFGFSGSGSPSELPTGTEEGRIVGTVAYMSPEQAEGKSVDARSDIFSLGILLYEMATGVRPFRGESATAVLSAIIRDTPVSVTDLRPSIPRDLAKIIRRCLAKEPVRRFQTAIDLRNELEECKSDVDSGEVLQPAVAISPKASRRWWFAAVGVGAAVGVTSIVLREDTLRPNVPRLSNPVQLTFALGVEDFPTWSPDGRTLAYSATAIEHKTRYGGDIWVTQSGRNQPVNRTADHPGGDCCPSWSPDGSEIAFWSAREGGGYFIMSALGGPARRVLAFAGEVNSAPQWSLDGQELAAIVVDAESHFVEIVNLRTQESRRLALPGRSYDRLDLAWSRDGRFF
ncbi:MAG TPA: protein kinase, partial [Vicinamibacteria bacterium]|nr:protein kinase [Vicinamibacteria bacterium]